MTFKKGQSGNPGGRVVKTDAVREAERMAREATPAAVRKLIAHMDHEDPNVAQRAIFGILDRGMGRPTQSIELTTHDVPLEAMTDDQLAAEIARRRDELRSAAKRIGGDGAQTAH